MRRKDWNRFGQLISRCTIYSLFISVTLGGRLLAQAADFQLATFAADVTIPLNHRCMGILPTKSQKIVDRLQARGWVLLCDSGPIVFCAIDWCEIRNGAYDQWRNALAKAAHTTRERVLITSLHQHDAPVVDSDAAQLLDDVGLTDELYHTNFHQKMLTRVAEALEHGLETPQTITHIGLGESIVERIASSRRVVLADGSITYGRGSRSGADPTMRDAFEGEIDPHLKSISLWNQDRPIAVLHSYATHPMSYYGQGAVTCDFVGLARDQRQRDDFSVHQIYASGCSGDVTAGKYNDGSYQSRLDLTERLYHAMVQAWQNTKRLPLEQIELRTTSLHLPYSQNPLLSEQNLNKQLHDTTQPVEQRIWAAMGLASRRRHQRGQAIDFPCIDFGAAQVLLFPGESFVAYQRMAQDISPNTMVMSIGYGECWPGYIPMDADFDNGFADNWLWVDRGSEQLLRHALGDLLQVAH